MVKGSRLRGQGVKGLGHSIGQTITVLYGVWAWSCWHIVNGNKTCRRLFTRVIFKEFYVAWISRVCRPKLPNVALRK